MIEALIVPFWIPASRLGEALRRSLVAGMTVLCREATQDRQNVWTLFVIPDQTRPSQSEVLLRWSMPEDFATAE